MLRLAKLQLIGPAVLLLGIAGAELVALALPYAPGSAALWYVHLNLLGPFRQGRDIMAAAFGVTHGQLDLIGVPLLLVTLAGFCSKRPLVLAIASNLSLVYASFLTYAWHAHGVETASLAAVRVGSVSDGYLGATLLGCALLSFAASHIIYIRAIRACPRSGHARIFL